MLLSEIPVQDVLTHRLPQNVSHNDSENGSLHICLNNSSSTETVYLGLLVAMCSPSFIMHDNRKYAKYSIEYHTQVGVIFKL